MKSFILRSVGQKLNLRHFCEPLGGTEDQACWKSRFYEDDGRLCDEEVEQAPMLEGSEFQAEGAASQRRCNRGRRRLCRRGKPTTDVLEQRRWERAGCSLVKILIKLYFYHLFLPFYGEQRFSYKCFRCTVRSWLKYSRRSVATDQSGSLRTYPFINIKKL